MSDAETTTINVTFEQHAQNGFGLDDATVSHVLVEPHDNGKVSVFLIWDVEERDGAILAQNVLLVRDNEPVKVANPHRGMWPAGGYYLVEIDGD